MIEVEAKTLQDAGVEIANSAVAAYWPVTVTPWHTSPEGECGTGIGDQHWGITLSPYSLLRKGKKGRGTGQLPVQHLLSETFNGGETPLPVHLQRLITSHHCRRTLLLLDPGGGRTGSLSGPALGRPWDASLLWVTPSSEHCPFFSVAQVTAASRVRWKRTTNPSGSGA